MIDEDGEQLGIVNTNDAIRRAYDKHLDLAVVSPNANPPVARILDYGKYKYERDKKEQEARRKQRTITVKEVRLSPNIEEHDLNVKVNQANRFLKAGDRVKVSVRFRGREMGHQDLGREVLNKIIEKTKEYGQVEKSPKMEGRNMVMFLEERREKK